MATIKSHTTIEQSRNLAEILPLESADMYYREVSFAFYKVETEIPRSLYGLPPKGYYCWSLAALLGVLPLVDFTTPQLIGTPKTLYRCVYNDDLKSHAYDNPVDACYELILKLNELNLL